MLTPLLPLLPPGVFFSNILLRILETPNSSGQQKLLVVQSLRVLVRDPQLIVDLFLNYDCDLEGKGIYTSMCDDLSRLAATNQALTESTEQVAHAHLPTCPHRLAHSKVPCNAPCDAPRDARVTHRVTRV